MLQKLSSVINNPSQSYYEDRMHYILESFVYHRALQKKGLYTFESYTPIRKRFCAYAPTMNNSILLSYKLYIGIVCLIYTW